MRIDYLPYMPWARHWGCQKMRMTSLPSGVNNLVEGDTNNIVWWNKSYNTDLYNIQWQTEEDSFVKGDKESVVDSEHIKLVLKRG